jgi:predicted permease
MLQDIRVAWLFLRKGGISTTLATLTLGITVAMCSVAAGVLDETFWRPLPFENGERLITILNSRVSEPSFQVLSYPDYITVRDGLSTGAELAAFVRVFKTVGDGEVPARVQGELVSGNYFAVLRARPFIGRLFTSDDDRIPSGHPLVVLGYDFWRGHFGADRAVVGKAVRLNRHGYTVIGVASEGFQSPAWPSQFWIPVMMAREAFGGLDVLARADIPILQTVAAAPSVSLEQVRGRVQALETSVSREGWRLTALPGAQLRFWPGHREAVSRFLGVFAALAVCVLIIACANVAGLLVARTGERQRDLAIRQALGATRGHLLRRLAAESLVLTMIGGAIGLILTYLAATLLDQVAVPAPIEIGLTPNFRLAFIAISVSLGASLVFTTVFAVKALGTDIRGVLAFFTATVAPKAGLQRILVVTQIAISCVCLTAAGLLLRTALAVERVDPGFDVASTMTGMIALGDQDYTPETGAAFYERLQGDLESTPNIEAVALAWHEPLGAVRATGRFSAI